MKIKINNLVELENWIIKNLIPEIKEETLFLLNGPLGAGKTEIVKIVSRLLGSHQVQSPTFSFHNQYNSKNGLKLHHIDLYRIKSQEDIESIGFWDLLNQEPGVFFIEWASLISSEDWPINKKIKHITIFKTENGTREIQFENN